MKSLRCKIFVILTHSLLFLKLFSMEDEKPNKLSQTYPLDLDKKKFKIKISSPKNNQKTDKIPEKITDKIAEKNDQKINPLQSESEEESAMFTESEILIQMPFAINEYLGPLPEGATHIMQAFHENIVGKKLQPILIKVVGPKDVGKSVLIRTIGQRLSSDDSRYFEIDITKHYDSKLDPENYIQSVINNFYAQKNHIRSTAIIAFIKGLPSKNIDFKKLRSFLSELQKPASLLVLHEAKKACENDYNYHDKIIHVDKPTQAHFKAFLAHIYNINGFKCESLSGETFARLDGFLIPRVQRIAEETMRKAMLGKTEIITNDIILESIGKKRSTIIKKESRKHKNEIII